MSTSEVISRIRRGEDSVTQFKRQAIGVAKLADEMVAFANAEGGVILFGGNDSACSYYRDRDANWLKAIVRRENKGGGADSTGNGTVSQKVKQKALEVEQKPDEVEQKIVKVRQMLSGKLREDAVRNALSVYACIRNVLELSRKKAE